MPAGRPKEDEAIEGLNPKQKLFCSKYIVDWNATKAYMEVYGVDRESAKVSASRLLTNDNIQIYVNHIQANLEKEIGISKSMVVKEHMKLAFNSIAHLHNTWIERKEFEDLTDEQKACIAEIQTRVAYRAGNEDDGPIEVQEIKIKLYDRQKSLDAISKLLGYNAAEKVEGTNDTTLTIRREVKIKDGT